MTTKLRFIIKPTYILGLVSAEYSHRSSALFFPNQQRIPIDPLRCYEFSGTGELGSTGALKVLVVFVFNFLI